MKKTITCFSLLLCNTLVFGQFTQSNEPVISNSVNMYLIDSNTVNLASTMGSGVTWDYSQIVGYPGETRNMTVVAPNSTANGASFSSASAAIEVSNLTNYFSSSASSRNAHGFVVSDPTLGDVVVTLTNDEIMMNYPFAYNDMVTDTYSGSLNFNFNGLPVSEACTGSSFAKVDGSGTLNLPNGTVVSNVLRYKLVDTTNATITLLSTDVQVVREQYEYYDLANSNLPIFVHSSFAAYAGGGTTPVTQQSLVLSSVAPQFYLAVNELNGNEFKVYPNPVNESLNVQFDHVKNGTISILDLNGKTVFTTEINGLTMNINTAQLVSGIYLLQVASEGSISTQKITKK